MAREPALACSGPLAKPLILLLSPRQEQNLLSLLTPPCQAIDFVAQAPARACSGRFALSPPLYPPEGFAPLGGGLDARRGVRCPTRKAHGGRGVHARTRAARAWSTQGLA